MVYKKVLQFQTTRNRSILWVELHAIELPISKNRFAVKSNIVHMNLARRSLFQFRSSRSIKEQRHSHTKVQKAYFETTVVCTVQSKSFRGRHKSKTNLQTASLLEWSRHSRLAEWKLAEFAAVLSSWRYESVHLEFIFLQEKRSFRAKQTAHVGSGRASIQKSTMRACISIRYTNPAVWGQHSVTCPAQANHWTGGLGGHFGSV